MHASATYTQGASKVTKIAIVTALHLGVALALINMKVFTPAPPKALPPVKIVREKTPNIVDPVPPAPMKTDTLAPPPPIVIPLDPIATDLPIIKDTTPTGEFPIPGPVVPGVTPGGKGLVVAALVPPEVKKQVYSAALANANDCVRPDYPARAIRNGDTGTVNLALLIGADGRVTDAKVERSSGFRDLDRAAVAALSLCKFKPATTNGVAESAWGKIAYVWTID